MASATVTVVRGATRTTSGNLASRPAPARHRAPISLPSPDPAALLPVAGRAAQRRLRHLQRTVGNRAVAQLLAVQRADPGADDGGALDPRVGDPLADPRIAWIDGLDAHIKANIDKVSGRKLKARVRQLTELITTAKARVEAAQEGTPDRKQAERELANLEKLQTTVYTRRIAFMDYMECSLGGDAGTRRYWQSLVHMGGGLVVHPQVAIRLDRVEKKLAEHELPMPQTSVGQSLRGDHTRNKRERNSPGMLAHAMGLAVDWFAYKNIHQKDPRLRALIEAVTGESSTMQLGPRKGGMYKALGRSATDDLPEQRAFLDRVESEFTRLSKLSDRLQKLAPSPAIKDYAAEWYAHDAAVAKLKERLQKKRGAARKALQAELGEAVRARDAKRAELKPKFFAAFAPWRAAVKVNQFGKRMQAHKLGWSDLESVSTAKGRRWHAQQIKLPKRARAQLRQAYSRARSSRRALHRLAGDVDAALAAVNATTRLDIVERATLAGELSALSVLARSGAASARNTLERSSVLLAKGSVGDLPTRKSSGAPDLSDDRRFTRWRRRLDRSLGRWRKQVTRHQGRVGEAAAKLTQGEQAVPAAAREHAEQRWHLMEKEVEIRAALGGDKREVARKLARLQDLKREWLLLDQVNTALSKDIGFIISPRSVGKPTPSAVQLLGLTPGTLGGGFFGAPAAGKSKAHQNPEGFNQLFFRYMAAEGFDLGAAWSSGDSMHFEFEELQDAIIPPAACEEPPPPRKETARARADYLEEVARRKALRDSRGGFVEAAVGSKREADRLGLGVKPRP